MNIISDAEFLKQIKASPSGAFLFYGDEDYLKLHAISSLKKAMGIDEALEIFNFIKLDVLDYTPDKLIDALSIPPMMAEQKLVVLSGVDVKKMRPDEINNLCDAIAHLEEFDYNTFVLLVPVDCFDEGFLPRKPSGALNALSKLLTPVKFEKSSPQKLAVWVGRHLQSEGVGISQEDCACLVDYCGKSMFTLHSEIEKLAFYVKAQDRACVQRQDIFEVCCAEVEYTAFEFANAIMENRRADALKTLSAMKFKQVEPLSIMGELAGVYCDLLNTKLLMLAGKGIGEIAPLFKGSEYRAKLYMNKARAWELDSLRRLVEMTKQADAEMKLSDRSFLPLEKLICSI